MGVFILAKAAALFALLGNQVHFSRKFGLVLLSDDSMVVGSRVCMSWPISGIPSFLGKPSPAE